MASVAIFFKMTPILLKLTQ